MTLREFFSFRKNRFFWLNIAAMVLVLIAAPVAVLQWLDTYTRHGEAVVVPDVKGLSVPQAAERFARVGLVYQVTDSTYVKIEPAGCILENNPPAGQRVKEGRIVYLTVNTTSIPLVDVPDLADNSSARQARARLLATGFLVTDNDSVPGDRDWVYAVKYKGRPLERGERVPEGATLTLVVGNGLSMPLDSAALDSLVSPAQRHLFRQRTAAADSVAQEPVVEDSWF